MSKKDDKIKYCKKCGAELTSDNKKSVCKNCNRSKLGTVKTIGVIGLGALGALASIALKKDIDFTKKS